MFIYLILEFLNRGKKKIEFQGEINNPTIKIGDFNALLSISVRVGRKISKNIQDLNSILNTLEIINIYRNSTVEYTFSSITHEIFAYECGTIFCYKINLSKFKRIQFKQVIFWLQCNKLEITNKKITRKILKYLENK